MTDEELHAALTEAARATCGGFNNDYHKRMEIRRIVALLEILPPLRYAQMYQALLPVRDKPNWTECSLWETVTGSKTIGM